MTTWTDKSDSKSRFLDGGESTASTTAEALVELFGCLKTEIVGKGTANNFNLLLFEVNCDTGRLLAAATTSVKHKSGIVDGCSLRVQEVQDFWYDLLECGPSDEQFSTGIRQRIIELGKTFRGVFTAHIEELAQSCSGDGFTYRVYGSDPGAAVYEEMISMT
ncbi:MAG: hypothetical protein Q8M16_19090 [Pirellulaceae bacterium]|nr:hypothetical protein [Pirellulaceae bacterium]